MAVRITAEDIEKAKKKNQGGTNVAPTITREFPASTSNASTTSIASTVKGNGTGRKYLTAEDIDKARGTVNGDANITPEKPADVQKPTYTLSVADIDKLAPETEITVTDAKGNPKTMTVAQAGFQQKQNNLLGLIKTNSEDRREAQKNGATAEELAVYDERATEYTNQYKSLSPRDYSKNKGYIDEQIKMGDDDYATGIETTRSFYHNVDSFGKESGGNKARQSAFADLESMATKAPKFFKENGVGLITMYAGMLSEDEIEKESAKLSNIMYDSIWTPELQKEYEEVTKVTTELFQNQNGYHDDAPKKYLSSYLKDTPEYKENQKGYTPTEAEAKAVKRKAELEMIRSEAEGMRAETDYYVTREWELAKYKDKYGKAWYDGEGELPDNKTISEVFIDALKTIANKADKPTDNPMSYSNSSALYDLFSKELARAQEGKATREDLDRLLKKYYGEVANITDTDLIRLGIMYDNGDKAWSEYSADILEPRYNVASEKEKYAWYNEINENGNFWSKTGAGILGFGESFLYSPYAAIESMASAVDSNVNKSELPTYKTHLGYGQFSSLKSGVDKGRAEIGTAQNADVLEFLGMDRESAEAWGGGIYGLTNSIAENLARSPLGVFGGAAMMFAQSFATEYKSGVDAYSDPTKNAIMSTVTAFSEGLTEKIELGALNKALDMTRFNPNHFKRMVKAARLSGANEILGELTNDAVRYISDYALNGEESELHKQARKLVVDGKAADVGSGMMQILIKSGLNTAAVSYISGVVLGGARGLFNYAGVTEDEVRRDGEKLITGGLNINELVRLGKESTNPETKKIALEIEKAVASGEGLDGFDVQMLFSGILNDSADEKIDVGETDSIDVKVPMQSEGSAEQNGDMESTINEAILDANNQVKEANTPEAVKESNEVDIIRRYKNKLVKSKGIHIDNDFGYDLYAAENNIDGKKTFSIVEKSSGLEFGSGDTIEEAVTNATTSIESVGKEETDQVIRDKKIGGAVKTNTTSVAKAIKGDTLAVGKAVSEADYTNEVIKKAKESNNKVLQQAAQKYSDYEFENDEQRYRAIGDMAKRLGVTTESLIRSRAKSLFRRFATSISDESSVIQKVIDGINTEIVTARARGDNATIEALEYLDNVIKGENSAVSVADMFENNEFSNDNRNYAVEVYAKSMEKAFKASGVDVSISVYYDNSDGAVRGDWTTKGGKTTITLNGSMLSGEQSAFWVLSHELSHEAESKALGIAQRTLKVFAEMGIYNEKQYEAYRNRYQAHENAVAKAENRNPKRLSKTYIEGEIAADLMSETMGSTELLEMFAGKLNDNDARVILSFLKKIASGIKKVFNSKDTFVNEFDKVIRDFEGAVKAKRTIESDSQTTSRISETTVRDFKVYDENNNFLTTFSSSEADAENKAAQVLKRLIKTRKKIGLNPPDAIKVNAVYFKGLGEYNFEIDAATGTVTQRETKKVTDGTDAKSSDTEVTKKSLSSIGAAFYGNEKMTANEMERMLNDGSWKESEGYKKYLDDCVNVYKQAYGKATKSDIAQTEKEIEGIMRVAVAAKKAGYDILDNGAKRSTKDSKNRLLFSSLEPNSDYITSSDISAICDKRKTFTEIYDEIVRIEEANNVAPNERFFSKVDNYFILHKIMAEKGLVVPCEECYVESMRKNLAPMANAFITLAKETNAENKKNAQLYNQSGKNKGKLKENNAKIREKVIEICAKSNGTQEQIDKIKSLSADELAKFIDDVGSAENLGVSLDELTLPMLTTAEGLAKLKLRSPLLYEAFNSFYGQSKPKMPKEATPFRPGELIALFTDKNNKINTTLIEKVKSTGGFRLQSYSDFQIGNFVDVLQTIFEASMLGLNGHAYTKVPAFLDATNGTNLKRNLSIFMYEDGGKWMLDKKNSFPMELDDIYALVAKDKSGNTSIIAVSQNAKMSAWIMANDLVGYGIPFHKSGLKMDIVRLRDVVTPDGRTIKGYSNQIDHTKQQSEVYKYDKDGKKKNSKVSKPIDIYSFWDFENKKSLSKNKLIRKNLEAYIDKCDELGYLPKFRDYVMNNDKVLKDVLAYSKELGFVSEDATIDDISFKHGEYTIPYGYYKFLGDFGMFTPEGEASPIKPLSLAEYDFDKAAGFFDDAKALREKELLQQFENGKVREEYRQLLKEGKMTYEELQAVLEGKKNEVVREVVEGGKTRFMLSGEFNKRITADMSEEERYEILKDRDIVSIPTVDKIPFKVLESIEKDLNVGNISSWEDINKHFRNKKRNLILKIASEFGVFKEYKNLDIGLTFEFSKNNFRESYGKQKKDYESYAKMFSVFDEVVDKAVGIEVHNRNEEGYKPDVTLNNAYVMASAFESENFIYPVKLEVKEFNDKQNTLYVAVSLGAIKKTEVSKQGTTDNSVAQNSRSVNVSIHDLFKNINSQDVNFLKYIPSQFLTNEQKEAVRIYKQNKAYMDAVKNGDMASAQKIVDEAAKKAMPDSKVVNSDGNMKNVFHGTSKGGFTWFDTYAYYSKFGLFGNGAYFTEDKAIAEQYTKKGRGNKPQVYSVFLNITNPIDMDAKADIEAWNKVLKKSGEDFSLLDSEMTNEQAFKRMVEDLEYAEVYSYDAAEIVRNVFEDMGYNGITHIGGGRVGQSDGTKHRVWIAFEPEQIKSADTITYDADNNIIPLSERFNPEKTDIRYSLPGNNKLDTEYLELAKNPEKNEAKLQKIIDEEAVKWGCDVDENGKPVKFYHGTDNFGFTQLDVSVSDDGISFFATDSLEVARTYVGNKTKTDADVRRIGKKGDENTTELRNAEIKEHEKTLKKLLVDRDDMIKFINKKLRLKTTEDLYDISGIVAEAIDRIENGMSYNEAFFGDGDFVFTKKPWSTFDDAFDAFAVRYAKRKHRRTIPIEEYRDTEEYNDLYGEWLFYEGKLSSALSQLGAITENKGIYAMYGKTGDFLEIDAGGSEWNDILVPGAKELSTREVAELAKEQGYAGVKISNLIDDGGRGKKRQTKPATVYIFFNPSEQMKSADTVTYDDNGNVIPISERFSEKGDIRWALSDNGNMSLEDAWNEKIEKYGAIPKGMNPARDVKVPKRISDNKYVSRTARSAIESGLTPAEFVPEFQKDILDGKFTYERFTDEKAENKAKELIEYHGFEDALRHWDFITHSGGAISKENFAFGIELYNQCAQNGDFKNAEKILADISAEATIAGQAIQAMSMLKKMSPDGTLYYLERSIDKINDELVAKFGEKRAKKVKINEDLANRYFAEKDAAKREKLYKELCKDIGEQIPSTFWEKDDAWRYLSMLFNPTTHMRNFAGNILNLIVTKINNTIEGAIQPIFIKQEDRTKTLKGADKKTVEFAKNDWKLMKDMLTSGEGKYGNVISDIDKYRRILRPTKNAGKVTKVVGNALGFAPEMLNKFNSLALEKEDMLFLGVSYRSALKKIITARKLDVDNISSEELSKIRELAIKEAKRATFREANALAEAISRTRAKLMKGNLGEKVGGIALGGLFPFTKTPMNITKQSLETSPLGVFKTAYDVVEKSRGKAVSGNDIIADVARTFTGTGLFILGAVLARAGVVSAGDDEDKDKKRFDKLVGEQSYAINFRDGKSYTIDWATPASIPFLVGAQFFKTIEEEGLSFKTFADSIGAITEPVIGLSMLDGLRDFLESDNYSDNGAPTAAIESILSNFILQHFPTLGGKIKRIASPQKKNYYFIDKNSETPEFVQELYGSIASKLPFEVGNYQASVDLWGRIENYGGVGERLAENLISPGYYSEDNYTDVDNEILRLYESTGNGDVFPKKMYEDITISGNTYYMNAEQYKDAAVMLGERRFDMLSRLFNDEIVLKNQDAVYSEMTDSEKSSIVMNVYKQALDETKYAMLDDVKGNTEDSSEATAIQIVKSKEDEANSINKGNPTGVNGVTYVYWKQKNNFIEQAQKAIADGDKKNAEGFEKDLEKRAEKYDGTLSRGEELIAEMYDKTQNDDLFYTKAESYILQQTSDGIKEKKPMSYHDYSGMMKSMNDASEYVALAVFGNNFDKAKASKIKSSSSNMTKYINAGVTAANAYKRSLANKVRSGEMTQDDADVLYYKELVSKIKSKIRADYKKRYFE